MAHQRKALLAAVALAALATGVSTNVDLPVATEGTQQWAATVARAMSYGAKDHAGAMDNFQSFQSKVMDNLAKTGADLQKLSQGDISGLLQKAMQNAVSITAPVFFANNGGPQSTLEDTIAAISFSYAGLSVAPCAIPITPIGVGIFPAGVNIEPIGAYIVPEGVNVQPQGANISPSLIVIGPYDTTVAGQGLNIAPTLIAISPVKTVVNPVGPLAISDSLVSATVPALP